jgi:hypothetical protein
LCNATKPLNRPLVTTHNVRRSTMWSKTANPRPWFLFKLFRCLWKFDARVHSGC